MKKIRFDSLKVKTVIFYAAIFSAVSILVFRGVLYVNFYNRLYRDLDGQLAAKAQELRNNIHSVADAVGGDKYALIFAARKAFLLSARHKNEARVSSAEAKWNARAKKLGLDNDYMQLLTSDGSILVCSSNLERRLRLLFLNGIKSVSRDPVFRNVDFHQYNLKLRLVSFPFTYRDQGSYILQLGSSSSQAISILRGRLLSIAISVVLVLLLAGFIGWRLLVRLLKPIADIAHTARDITMQNLGSRVRTDGAAGEVKYMTESFNDMVGRLQESFKYIDDFSSHVAHELKTPLAIIKGESEVALRRERQPEEYRRVLEVNLEETERMLKIIDGMLLMARLDYKPDAFTFEELDLAGFLRQLHKEAGILAAEKKISVDLEMKARQVIIKADRLHLRRLFFNLITNAIKFTPVNGRITLTVKPGPKSVSVCISDTGPGIAETDLPNIFRKFYSADPANRTAKSGTGLGLSIAQSIARIHHGEIEVESQPGKGASFTVVIPVV